MPELTVAMPAYNTGRYIGEAIESVLRQEGVDFELVVVDDGSADDTVRVVRGFPSPRIRLIENGARRGIAHCHNVVLERSTAPFLAHVDSDDLILPGALPYVLTGLRLGLARAWRVLIAVEMLTSVSLGLGWLIFGAREFLATDVMLAGIAVIGIVGLALEKLVFERLEHYTVVRWGMLAR